MNSTSRSPSRSQLEQHVVRDGRLDLEDLDAQLVGDDVGERRLAQPGGPTSSMWSSGRPLSRAALTTRRSRRTARACPMTSSKFVGRSGLRSFP
jgi:hypothetical protein